MKTIRKESVGLWARRLLVYVCGLFCIALGIAFSARSGLGVPPVGSPANVLYQIGRASGLPEKPFNLGNWTIAVYGVYILAQVALLGKRFRPVQLLQLVVSFLFGYMVNLAVLLVSGLPDPGNYAARLLYLFVNIPLVALGVMMYLIPDLLPTPGEGTVLAMRERWNTSVGTGKTIFDCTVVAIAVILSLVRFRGFVGVREGTVISALLTGFVIKFLQRFLQKPLYRFVWGGDENA